MYFLCGADIFLNFYLGINKLNGSNMKTSLKNEIKMSFEIIRLLSIIDYN